MGDNLTEAEQRNGNPFGGPIYVPVKPYQGKDAAKRVRFQSEVEQANRIEEYLNAKYIKGQPQTIDYWIIAQDTGIPKTTVAKLLFPVRGGSNGITF